MIIVQLDKIKGAYIFWSKLSLTISNPDYYVFMKISKLAFKALYRFACKFSDRSNITRGVARIAPDKRLVLSEYLLWAIRSPLFRENLLRKVNGSALQEIPIAQLRKVIVPVPSIERQQAISKALDIVAHEITILQAQLNLLRSQKRGLMQKLLTGEWRVKIEETATQLTEVKE